MLAFLFNFIISLNTFYFYVFVLNIFDAADYRYHKSGFLLKSDVLLFGVGIKFDL